MPSTDHELTLDLLRRRPALVAHLLRSAFGLEVPDELVPASETFSQLEPSTYLADLVLESEDLALVIECQRQRDARKLRSWPSYAAGAHAATGKRTLLVVLAFDPDVAEWARRPIATFQDGAFRPLVLSAVDIPRLTGAQQARAQPELAVLSALAHGRDEGALEVGLAGWYGAGAVAREDENRGKLYADAVLASLTSENAELLLEVVMKTEGHEYKSEWMRRNFAEGKAEGKAEGLREAVRSLCEALGLGWSDARSAVVTSLAADDLERLVVRLGTERRWPDDA